MPLTIRWPEVRAETPSESKAEKPKAEKESKRLVKRKKRRGGFSINETLYGEDKKDAEQEEERDETLPDPGAPKEGFTEQELLNFWNEFLQKLKEGQERTTYSSLRSSKLILRDNFEVELQIESEAQAQFFESVKRELLLFLRQKLNNFSLTFLLKKVKTAQTLEPYSAQEKFEYMVKKNKHLLELKKRLDLDLE